MESSAKRSRGESGIERILDANLNRLREGVRVIEDVMRYAFDESTHTTRLKALRHGARLHIPLNTLASRDIQGDVAKKSHASELARESLESILLANFKRTQESARVLEETLKLVSQSESERFKALRYELYELERAILASLENQIEESHDDSWGLCRSTLASRDF